MKPPRRGHSARGYLTHTQVAALVAEISVQPVTFKTGYVKHVPQPTYGTIVRLLAYTGLRWGEMAALRVSDFRPRHFLPAVERCQATDPTFPNVSPHSLRHTAASLTISAGANVKAVQTMLGHKSAAMTLDTYADLFPDDLEQVAAALQRAATRQTGK